VTTGTQASTRTPSRSTYATERAYAIADRCLQVFGGMGLLREGPVERVLRHLRILRVVEGASEVLLW
jgi:acyl-CoA dehydrogenase